MTATFKLVGRPASKKNNRIVLKKQGRVIDIPSNAYRAYKKECVKQIVEQTNGTKLPLAPWYKVTAEVYYKTMLRLDCDNILSSLLDIFQDAGIITDDKFVGETSIKVKLNTRGEDYVVVNISEVPEESFVA